jgi:anti-sigma factor RsiW
MERITQTQDDQLLHYLDGTLSSKDKIDLEATLAKNSHLQNRLEELRSVHVALAFKAKLEQPSKLFTDKVLQNLDRIPARTTLSPTKGLLLLCGILVAVGALALLVSIGMFDNMSETISLEKLPVENKYLKNPLPSVPFDGKWMVNGIMILTMGLAFVLLDRTVLKPYFDKRSRMQF